jgi:nicotinamidase-related amidase
LRDSALIVIDMQRDFIDRRRLRGGTRQRCDSAAGDRARDRRLIAAAREAPAFP